MPGLEPFQIEHTIRWVNDSRDKYGSFASDDNKLKQFNNSISQIKTITHSLEIDFRDNYLKDETLQGICDLIMNNQSIQKLVLWVTSNYITDIGAQKIIASISKVPNIRTLSINFDWNFEISNDTVKYLIAALKKMPNLSQLNVRLSKHTRVDDEGKQIFITAVKELPNIKKWTWDSSALG